jgi:hypothetical protein
VQSDGSGALHGRPRSQHLLGRPLEIFFGFAFRYPGSCYVNDSSIVVSYPGNEMDGFAHDNPPGFGNTLIVNGIAIED